jgi:hypothetical protein
VAALDRLHPTTEYDLTIALLRIGASREYELLRASSFSMK